MPIRITGMNSGLDTEALVSELVSAYRKKSEKYTKAQTKLSWKQDAWKTLNGKVSTLFSSIRNMKYSSAYTSKKASISDASKASVTAKSGAVTGSYSLKINQVAKTAYLTGGEMASSVKAGSTLAELGYTGQDGKISVTANGKTTDIDVKSSTTVSDFVKSLNEAGVSANFDAANHRIFVSAGKSGEAGNFSISGSNVDGNIALTKLGLSVGNSAEMSVYREYAAFAKNTNGDAYITYDDTGKAVINGTFDETKTKAYIEEIKNKQLDSELALTNEGKKASYAKAYKTVSDANAKLSDSEKFMLEKLGSAKDISKMSIGSDGSVYEKKDDGSYIKYLADGTKEDVTAEQAENLSLTDGADKLADLEGKAGVTGIDYAAALTVFNDSVLKDEFETEVSAAYTAGTIDSYIADAETKVKEAQDYLKTVPDLIKNDKSSAENIAAKISNAAKVVDGTQPLEANKDVVYIKGQDTEIELNGAVFKSTTNELTVNGLTINALAPTTEELTVSVTNDSQGVYDTIKKFIKDYNTLMNEMTSLYNADSAKGYEPLTSEEKDAMTDTEIEEWEKKIKGSLLRRDDNLDSLMSSMKNAMFKSYTINGKSYSLSSFGISTLGVLNAADNEENAFHIDGDSEDTHTSGKADRLLTALQEDPDTVTEFMKQLATGLYDTIDKKMSSSTLSSFGMVYNDKEMAREYSDYTKTISKWEEKLKAIEDSYYKKFAAMESALATLQSQQSSLAGLFGQ